MSSKADACPCGLPLTYELCCGPLHAGHRQAMTAEQVMRARYSAFARDVEPFLAESWHSTTRPKAIRLDAAQTWTRLDVVASTGGGLLDQEGTVEFQAHHRRGDKAGVLHEVSRFVREDGRWVYVGPLDIR